MNYEHFRFSTNVIQIDVLLECKEAIVVRSLESMQWVPPGFETQGNVTSSPKQEYQWPHKKGHVSSKKI